MAAIDAFADFEMTVLRFAVLVIFVIGLGKVVWDKVAKILK